MNHINPEKLHHSKWTATRPVDKEKHFLVTDVVRDDDDVIREVVLEAVLTRRERVMPWQSLTDDQTWQMGWL